MNARQRRKARRRTGYVRTVKGSYVSIEIPKALVPTESAMEALDEIIKKHGSIEMPGALVIKEICKPLVDHMFAEMKLYGELHKKVWLKPAIQD